MLCTFYPLFVQPDECNIFPATVYQSTLTITYCMMQNSPAQNPTNKRPAKTWSSGKVCSNCQSKYLYKPNIVADELWTGGDLNRVRGTGVVQRATNSTSADINRIFILRAAFFIAHNDSFTLSARTIVLSILRTLRGGLYHLFFLVFCRRPPLLRGRPVSVPGVCRKGLTCAYIITLAHCKVCLVYEVSRCEPSELPSW